MIPAVHLLSLLLLCTQTVIGFGIPLRHTKTRLSTRVFDANNSPVDVTNAPPVFVYKSQTDISVALCDEFKSIADDEIKKKGAFYVCVPGGSALKLLSGLKNVNIDWSKVFMFYVNHKCVSNEDPTATHFKAKNYFLDAVGAKNVVTVATSERETQGHSTIAHFYEKDLKDIVPLKNGLPHFDLMVLGMGKDGHIGSLYPNRKEVEITEPWILTVDKVIK